MSNPYKDELKVEILHKSGVGGFNLEDCLKNPLVKVTHLPTGIEILDDSTMSQKTNYINCLEELIYNLDQRSGCH